VVYPSYFQGFKNIPGGCLEFLPSTEGLFDSRGHCSSLAAQHPPANDGRSCGGKVGRKNPLEVVALATILDQKWVG